MNLRRSLALLVSGTACLALASPAVADQDADGTARSLNLTVAEADDADSDGTTETTTLTVSPPSDGRALAAGALVCNVSVNNPHYSKGAPGVIAKVRYTCSGNLTGTLGVNANIYRYAPGAMGPFAPRASNNQSRSVGPLAEGTVYVPAASLPGIACNLQHWYYATAFLTLSAGPSSSTGSVSSATVHPTKCG